MNYLRLILKLSPETKICRLNWQKLGLGLLRDSKENGFPLISIDTFENAGKAIASLSNEIEGVGEQLGRLASNFNQVQNAIEATQEMKNVSESVLSSVGGEALTQDLLILVKHELTVPRTPLF